MLTNDRTMLQFDWDKVNGQTVSAILGLPARPDSGRWWEIAIVLGSQAVKLAVDRDTDEISANLGIPPSADQDEWLPIGPMADALGHELGWCWIGRNYLGYLDMFTVSFSGTRPNYAFVGEASALSALTLAPIGGLNT